MYTRETGIKMLTFTLQQTERQGPVGGATSPDQERENFPKPAKR